jgi:hypothetical protein
VAYIFMGAGPILLILWGLFQPDALGKDGYRDAALLIVCGAFAFRALALGMRKWRDGSSPGGRPSNEDLLTTIFVLEHPTGRNMLFAQVAMWICLFCAIESFADVLRAAFNGSLNAEAKQAFILLFSAVFGAAMCRIWAALECSRPSAALGSLKILPLPQSRNVCLLEAASIAAVVLPLVIVLTYSVHFSDHLDWVEFAFIWLAVIVVCNQLMNRSLVPKEVRESEPPKAMRAAGSLS